MTLHRFRRGLRLLVLVAVLCQLSGRLHSADVPGSFSLEPCACAGESKVVGPAFKVSGRLSAWNGNPTFRIWIVGTKRMLGIRDGTGLPKELQALLGSFETEVMGDFVVCPLTRPKKGVMQIVCVGSASNLVKRTKSRLHS